MTDKDPKHTDQVLLIEGNPANVNLIRRGARMIALDATFHVVADTAAALAFLRKEDSYRGAPNPDAILLDLSLLGQNGKKLLAWIKADPGFRGIPVVVVFTSEDREEDVIWAYELGVNCCLIEPLSMEQLLQVPEIMEHPWFTAISPGSSLSDATSNA